LPNALTIAFLPRRRKLRNRHRGRRRSPAQVPTGTPRHFAPNDFFCRVGTFAVASTTAFSLQPSSSQDGVRFSAAGLRKRSCRHRAPSLKDGRPMEVSVFGVRFLTPSTAVTALRSQYFGNELEQNIGCLPSACQGDARIAGSHRRQCVPDQQKQRSV